MPDDVSDEATGDTRLHQAMKNIKYYHDARDASSHNSSDYGANHDRMGRYVKEAGDLLEAGYDPRQKNKAGQTPLGMIDDLVPSSFSPKMAETKLKSLQTTCESKANTLTTREAMAKENAKENEAVRKADEAVRKAHDAYITAYTSLYKQMKDFEKDPFAPPSSPAEKRDAIKNTYNKDVHNTKMALRSAIKKAKPDPEYHNAIQEATKEVKDNYTKWMKPERQEEIMNSPDAQKSREAAQKAQEAAQKAQEAAKAAAIKSAANTPKPNAPKAATAPVVPTPTNTELDPGIAAVERIFKQMDAEVTAAANKRAADAAKSAADAKKAAEAKDVADKAAAEKAAAEAKKAAEAKDVADKAAASVKKGTDPKTGKSMAGRARDALDASKDLTAKVAAEVTNLAKAGVSNGPANSKVVNAKPQQNPTQTR